jgi:maleylacetoacetate isomerase
MALKLYSFWRSIATFRVRIALNLKGVVPDELVFVDLLKGQQREDAFREVNPQMLLPALIDGEGPVMFQSMAIMEYLEETHPNPPLLPRDAKGRARVRGLCQIAVSDAHPMSVPRVRNYLTNELKLDQPTLLAWVRHWQNEALRAYETHLTSNSGSGRYCHGDAITLADICLVGQAVGSGFFDVDVTAYPAVSRIVDRCLENEAFAKAHPLKQPGAPASVSH